MKRLISELEAVERAIARLRWLMESLSGSHDASPRSSGYDKANKANRSYVSYR
jgi:hypothetical protein